MRQVCSAVSLVLILVPGCAKPSPERVTSAQPAPPNVVEVVKDGRTQKVLGCTIQGEPTCELGKAPTITVALTNQTDADVYLVGSLDASDCKWRYPHCYFEVTGPDGEPAMLGIGRCGLMNPLRTNDFVKVAPGMAFNPYQRIDDGGFFSAHQLGAHNFRVPGVYRIRFVYSSQSDDIGAWGGISRRAATRTAEIMDMFRQVPRVEVRSEEFAVTIVAPGT